MIVQHLVDSRQSAHAAATALYGTAWRGIEKGRSFLMQLISSEPDRRHQLRKMFHGPVLREISQQVWVVEPSGHRVRYTPKAWKQLFADLFIDPEFEEQIVNGRALVVELPRSTERLSDDAFAEFALKAMAYAVTDLNVVFQDPEHE